MAMKKSQHFQNCLEWQTMQEEEVCARMQTKGKQIIVKSEMIMPNLRIKHEDIATF
jgi:hypothetical protein